MISLRERIAISSGQESAIDLASASSIARPDRSFTRVKAFRTRRGNRPAATHSVLSLDFLHPYEDVSRHVDFDAVNAYQSDMSDVAFETRSRREVRRDKNVEESTGRINRSLEEMRLVERDC